MAISTDSYETINEDYKSALEWVKSLGVNLTSGRTQHYSKIINYWTNEYRTASEEEGKEVFPDFVSSMSEIMDFIEIYKYLEKTPLIHLDSIANKLQKGVNGPINAAKETEKSTTARNYIFEALVAARLNRPENGIQTIFDSPSDTGIKIEDKKIWIECKRVLSEKKLGKNISKASNQLGTIISKEISFCHRGIVAIDFTKILHPGDMLLVKDNDAELQQAISGITDSFITQYRHKWERIYKTKHKKIIGTLLRFSTMAVSEERNLMVRGSEWCINPIDRIKSSDKELLKKLANSLR